MGFPSTTVFVYPDDAPASSSVFSLAVTGNVANDGTVALYNACSGGTLTVSGTLTNESDGTIQSLTGYASTGVPDGLNSTIDNQGTIDASETNLEINQGEAASANTLTNEANSTIDAGTGQTLTIGGASVADSGAIEIGGTRPLPSQCPRSRSMDKARFRGKPHRPLRLADRCSGIPRTWPLQPAGHRHPGW